MPILVPAHSLFGEGVRAERVVWEVFRDQLRDEAVLFHGVRVQGRQNEYEADIVVLIPGAGWAVSRTATWATILSPQNCPGPC